MRTLLKGGRIIDPSQGLDKIADLLLDDSRIAAIGEGSRPDQTVDVSGKVVLPGGWSTCTCTSGSQASSTRKISRPVRRPLLQADSRQSRRCRIPSR